MSSILVATSREEVREIVARALAREGVPVVTAADWDGLCRGLCGGGSSLVLVDPTLPRLRPDLVASLAASLAHRPTVRTIGEALPPLAKVPLAERTLLRLARTHAGGLAVDPLERRWLRAQGLGPTPLERLAAAATSALPTLLHGDRGTGKERIARIIHRIGGREGPFRVVPPDAPWSPEGPGGTVYLESVHAREDVRAIAAAARDAGWRLIGGTRLPDVASAVTWDRLGLPPLRERPADLRELATLWLDTHARRMGLPKRTFDRGMWALLHAHRWPGNQRELEMFVVQVLGRVDAPIIRGAALPDDVRALLLPVPEAEQEVRSFEDMARARLAPVVRAYAPGGDDTLHGIVVGSTERALIQLVLARTQGNRKAAAALLGVARNTLQARIEALGLGATRSRE